MQRWRMAWQAWWLARLRPTDQVQLHQRNVYILPTRAGWMLGATLLVLLVASINYQLNLGYVLTFLLAGSAVAGMHVCHGTLRGIDMHLIAPSPHFARASTQFRIHLTHTRRSPRFGIGLAVQGSEQWSWTDLPAQGSATVDVAWSWATRGWHPLPLLTAETRFPLGIFRVWTLWRPAARVLIWPAPETPPPPLPVASGQSGDGAPAPTVDSGEFDGVRPYRRGDTQRQVVWRKSALALETGSGELTSRDSLKHRQATLWLDYMDTRLAAPEDRLSRLCAWVLQADQLGLVYGLRLPGRDLAPGCGEAHKLLCLEALATC